MSTGTSTGFCRVTVAAPDSRIDVALPEDLPIQDIYPEIVRLSGMSQTDGSLAGYHLVRRDGHVLDASRSLLEHRVRDGEVLLLRTFADSLPPAVHDDVVDAVASAVKQDLRSWNDNLMRVAGLVSGVLLLAMLGFVFWFADPLRHDMHGLQGIVAGVVALVLTALAGVRGRVYDDRASAVALGIAALPHALIAGSGVLPQDAGEGPGRLQFLVGCVAVLIFSVVLIMLLPQGDAPFVAAALAAAIGTLAAFGGVLTEAQPRRDRGRHLGRRTGGRRLPAGLVGPLRQAPDRFPQPRRPGPRPSRRPGGQPRSRRRPAHRRPDQPRPRTAARPRRRLRRRHPRRGRRRTRLQ